MAHTVWVSDAGELEKKMRPGNLIKEPGDEFLILVPSVAEYWIIRYDSWQAIL